MTPQDVEAVARKLESEGFFERVRAGSDRAASYFARLVAYHCNPSGDPSLPGCLKKGGGKNIDGYAEDAVVLNANPRDLHNVMDLVQGAGQSGASLRPANVNPRRDVDVWEAPRPLTPQEAAELGVSLPSTPVQSPAPKPAPVPVLPPELAQRLDTIQSALTFVINQIAAWRNDTLQHANQLATVNQKQDELALRVLDLRKTLDNGLDVKLHADLKGWGSAKGPISGVARG